VTFKPKIDDRYSKSEVVTHDGVKLPGRVVVVDTDINHRDIILKECENADVVAFDEAQFWEVGVLPEIINMLVGQKKRVYAAFLNKNHTGTPFANVGELLSIATRIKYCNSALCKKVIHTRDGEMTCNKPAAYTQRVDQNGNSVGGEIIEVGGKDRYSPRCPDCFETPITILLRRNDESKTITKNPLRSKS
jgi:thymidine kinase